MPLVHSENLDLFASGTDPLGGFANAFGNWLEHARRKGVLKRSASISTYADIWYTLARWCIAQTPPIQLESLSAADLETFLGSRSGASPGDPLSARYVWRFLHLTDRVLSHYALQGEQPKNDAAAKLLQSRPEWQYANASVSDTLPEYLTPQQASQLVAYLSEATPRASVVARSQFTWQELRNRASVALQLGAGLTPGDIRSLQVDSPITAGSQGRDTPWKISVPGDGNSAARESPIAIWAGRLLRHWLDVREELQIPGSYLFPSTKSGKVWGKVAQYLAVTRVLESAGFSEAVARGGSFRMRHTFALRQLRRGHPASDVARWLGVVDPSVMARYLRVLSSPVEDLA